MRPNTYEIDILVQQPVTVRVLAYSLEQAREDALAGKGQEIHGVDYTFGEVVDTREIANETF